MKRLVEVLRTPPSDSAWLRYPRETLLGSLFGVGAVYFISFLLLFLP